MNIIKINKDSGIPLLGLAYIGILNRNNNNIIQIRPTTICNMNCSFCSTDGGSPSKFDKNQFEVEISYLTAWVNEVINHLGKKIIAHIDSVGEPLMYPKLVQLVKNLKSMKEITEIATVTNGTLLTKDRIKDLEKAGLNKIIISIHSLNPERSKKLFGKISYDIEQIKKNIQTVQRSKIELILSPVYIPGLNDQDIEGLIQYAKRLDCNITIQKYGIHKYGRKVKSKDMNFYKFYKQLKTWERRYDKKLTFKLQSVYPAVNKIPIKFKKEEKIDVKIKSPGWLPDQKIGVAKNRAISIINCKERLESMKKCIITQTSNGIYIAE